METHVVRDLFVSVVVQPIHLEHRESIVSELALYADVICIYDQTKKPRYAYLRVKHRTSRGALEQDQ